MTQPSDVIDFWFVEHGPEQWFSGGEEFDRACATRLGSAHEQASRGELYHWRDSLDGRRAEIILLDQALPPGSIAAHPKRSRRI
ncbi:DUF924 family protein [Devosia algicola]|uniref:DUF924 family protein n=1 Tax=Devosia algicola TaxID=3026418 RepID=A0ABY7YLZ8_9HYPH|nr:DUF924 family protein [Devosia algicola]WDR02283.1 DUF924 family protein [Devosia algicola]